MSVRTAVERRSVRGFNPDKERTSSKLLRTAEKELVRRDLKVFVRGVLACFGVHSCIFLCGNQNAGEQEQDHEREREKTAELLSFAKPRLVDPFLLFVPIGQRHDSIGAIHAAGETYVEIAHIIKPKHGYPHRSSWTLGRYQRLESVFIDTSAI